MRQIRKVHLYAWGKFGNYEFGVIKSGIRKTVTVMHHTGTLLQFQADLPSLISVHNLHVQDCTCTEHMWAYILTKRLKSPNLCYTSYRNIVSYLTSDIMLNYRS